MNATAGRQDAGAGTPALRRVAIRLRLERGSREVGLAATVGGIPTDDPQVAQRFKNLRTGRTRVYGSLAWWVGELERRGAPPQVVRMIGEVVASYCADVADDMERRTVRRSSGAERARGVVAHISPPDPDPTPAAPARRAA